MNHTTLLELSLPRTLDTWVAQFEQPQWRGAKFEGWLFEGAAERRAAEQRLAQAGVQAQLRCAYKPLLHFFLEEIDCSTLAAVTIRYPVHPQAAPGRFLLEAYPLAALLSDCPLEFLAGSDDLHYQLMLTHRDGSTLQAKVFAANRSHRDAIGATLLSPTGWLRAALPTDAAPRLDSACQTHYEAVFERIVQAVAQHNWPAQEPYFERLDIRVDLPGFEQMLPLGHECISTFEALHEDIYFSLLELFQQRSGRPENDRRP